MLSSGATRSVPDRIPLELSVQPSLGRAAETVVLVCVKLQLALRAQLQHRVRRHDAPEYDGGSDGHRRLAAVEPV